MEAIGYLTAFELPVVSPPKSEGPEAPLVERRSPGENADETQPHRPYGRRLNDIGQEHRRYLEYV
jgi:hypothetical protein